MMQLEHYSKQDKTIVGMMLMPGTMVGTMLIPEKSNLFHTQPVQVHATNGCRWSQGVV